MLPPSKILKLFSTIDTSLNDDGYIVIYDFYNKPKSFKIKEYKHEKKLKVYRWDYKSVFLSLPYFKKKKVLKKFHLKTKDYVEVSLIQKEVLL